MDTYGAMQTFAKVVELGSFAAAATGPRSPAPS